MKQRADRLLVDQGIVSDRKEAEALILAGKVFVAGKQVPIKPGTQLDIDTKFHLKESEKSKFASFGGDKLADSLDHFQLSVAGKIALDIGASTGGFTDCLLRRGALRVYAVDVGYGLIDWKLRQDERVVLLERENIRYIDKKKIPELIEVTTVDVSFISVKKVVPVLQHHLLEGAILLILIKPEFEVTADEVPSGGIIRDKRKQASVLCDVGAFLEKSGFAVLGFHKTPKKRKSKNDEFFCHAVYSRPEVSKKLEEMVENAIRTAFPENN